jgi:integrase/recombinase XerD
MPCPIRYKYGWRVNFIHKRIRHRKKFPTQREADDYIRTALAGGIVLPPLAELLESYLHWSEFDKRKSSSWVANCRQMLGVFVKHIKVDRAEDIQAKHIRSFRSAFAHNPKRSDATWEKYRQAISAFLNWAVQHEYNVTNYAARKEFKIDVQQRRPRTFSREEIGALLGWAERQPKPYINVALRLLVSTGMRLGEMMKLTWADIDSEKHLIYVTATKTKTARTVPVAPELTKMVRLLPGKTALVFDDGSGHPVYDRHTYHRLLQRGCEAVAIPPRPIHALRHSFARFFIESGGDLPMLKQLMGHRDIRTTMIYADHFAIERAREAVARMGLP